MSPLLRVIIALVALVFSAFSIRLLLRRRISERSMILWLFGTLLVLIVAIVPQLLNWVAARVGVSYPPSLLYLVAIMTLLFLVLYQSIQLSRMDERIRSLGQTVALMKFQSNATSLNEAAAAKAAESHDGNGVYDSSTLI